MGLTALFDTPIYQGTATATSGDVPARYPVALDGRPFTVILQKDAIEIFAAHFEHESIPLLRDQADASNTPGEQSVSPLNLWRRAQDTWVEGAGQSYLDRATSVLSRFRSSKGVNPWGPWQLTLLPDTTRVRTSANTGLTLVVAGSNVYVGDGNTLAFSANATSYTTVTGTPAAPVLSLASDGKNVWAAFSGANGLYTTTSGAAAATQYVTSGSLTLVGYVNGRLMVADSAGKLYNIIASGALPTALLDLSGKGFTWVGFAEGPTALYAAGFAGDKSTIYKTAIRQDGTALDVPTVAALLPDGEIVRAIESYLGFMVIGSDKGFRFASINSDGSLTLGSLIATTSAVRCFEPQDRFVWFGMSNYDSVSSGLGRLDLSMFTSDLTPAWASDLMATAQGVVNSVVTFAGKRLFTVDGSGVWQESANLVGSGSLSTGCITYGIADSKGAYFVDVRHEPLNGGVAVSLATDGGTPVPLGTSAQAGSVAPNPMDCLQSSGERFELTLTLTRSGTDATKGPVVTRWVLRSLPKPAQSAMLTVPLALYEAVDDMHGTAVGRNPGDDYAFLRALADTKRLFAYQEGSVTHRVVIDAWKWVPQKMTGDGSAFQGVFLVQMKETTT